MFSGCRRSNGVQGLRVIVQSNRDPQYVEDRIEAFLHSMEVHYLRILSWNLILASDVILQF